MYTDRMCTATTDCDVSAIVETQHDKNMAATPNVATLSDTYCDREVEIFRNFIMIKRSERSSY